MILTFGLMILIHGVLIGTLFYSGQRFLASLALFSGLLVIYREMVVFLALECKNGKKDK